jgi:hypothetical protein
MTPQLIFEARRKVVLWTELRHSGSKQHCLCNCGVFECLENNPRIWVYILNTLSFNISQHRVLFSGQKGKVRPSTGYEGPEGE